MAKVYGPGHREIEGESTLTDGQIRAKEYWNSTKSAEAKKANAETRQSIREMRTPQQQLDLLNTRPGNSKLERARLEAK